MTPQVGVASITKHPDGCSALAACDPTYVLKPCDGGDWVSVRVVAGTESIPTLLDKVIKKGGICYTFSAGFAGAPVTPIDLTTYDGPFTTCEECAPPCENPIACDQPGQDFINRTKCCFSIHSLASIIGLGTFVVNNSFEQLVKVWNAINAMSKSGLPLQHFPVSSCSGYVFFRRSNTFVFDDFPEYPQSIALYIQIKSHGGVRDWFAEFVNEVSTDGGITWIQTHGPRLTLGFPTVGGNGNCCRRTNVPVGIAPYNNVTYIGSNPTIEISNNGCCNADPTSPDGICVEGIDANCDGECDDGGGP